MNDADRVWNRAAEAWNPESWVGLRPGDRALAALLAVHNLVQNGGVSHAIAVLNPADIERGVAGYRYFGLHHVANLVAAAARETQRLDLAALDVREELEGLWNRAYSEAIPSDSRLAAVFEERYAASPTDFAAPDVLVRLPPSPPPRGSRA